MTNFIQNCRKHDILGLSAKTAYYLLFAFFPLMMLVMGTISEIRLALPEFTVPKFALEMVENIALPKSSLIFFLLPVWRGIRAIVKGVKMINPHKTSFLSILITIIMWILATLGLQLYLKHFNSYSIYGSISAFLALALWLYLVSLAIFLAAEINACKYGCKVIY